MLAELDAGADLTARGGNGETPLHNASAFGTPAHIQMLLDAGADVMARANYGETPLHIAAKSSTHENTQVLLTAGADVTATLTAQGQCHL